ncbi:hypothetical protein BOTBODRAFT_79140, partial [Botryobasidium botryosum FD-172 SS1]
GTTLPPGAPPPPRPAPAQFSPFESRLQFELGEFLFKTEQMSNPNVNVLLELWAADVFKHNANPPFANAEDLQAYLDAIPYGDAPWQTLKVSYSGPLPENPPSWMLAEYEVVHRNPKTVLINQLDSPEFNCRFDGAPFKETKPNGKREFQNFMSGDWPW